jgi:hypothetical protein
MYLQRKAGETNYLHVLKYENMKWKHVYTISLSKEAETSSLRVILGIIGVQTSLELQECRRVSSSWLDFSNVPKMFDFDKVRVTKCEFYEKNSFSGLVRLKKRSRFLHQNYSSKAKCIPTHLLWLTSRMEQI